MFQKATWWFLSVSQLRPTAHSTPIKNKKMQLSFLFFFFMRDHKLQVIIGSSKQPSMCSQHIKAGDKSVILFQLLYLYIYMSNQKHDMCVLDSIHQCKKSKKFQVN